MTEENYNYRTSQIMLRNQFPGDRRWNIPIIPKFQEKPGDFDDLLLIGFDKTSTDEQKHNARMVHFFLYDYRFERVWEKPGTVLEKLRPYRAVLSPDFSMYLEMAPVLQLYNVFRNRWCGAYWASQGLRVVPTVNWGNETTFDFCFAGIEKGSVVAVSTYMASAHDNRCDQKEWFLTGYREMLRRIEPEKIICYHTPFPEMEGNIVYVDYERSSWRYLNTRQAFSKENLEDFMIGETYRPESDRIEAYLDIPSFKGGGSAYGGKWKPNPNKPADSRFLGEPGEIKRTFKDGYWVDTKIGDDGRAVMERHYTDHCRAHTGHTNPHDHPITWDNPTEHPHPGSAINYPNGAPEFKQYQGICNMKYKIVPNNTPEQNRFVSISDFKDCMRWGGEVEFVWNGIHYVVMRYGINNMITIYRMGYPETDRVCKDADEALEYMVGEDRLRDVITQVTVLDRTI